MNALPTNLPLPALVIPDIHNRIEWAEDVIAREGGDCNSIVFTGDYFDHYGDTPQDAYHTALWLQRSLRDPRRTHLLGNHDIGYFACGRQNATWGGWSEGKHDIIAQIFRKQDFAAMPLHLAAQAGPWLLSHAGFCGGRHSLLTDTPSRVLLHWAHQARLDLQHHMDQIRTLPPLIGIGWHRGGDRPVGGLFWCDFDREFVPLPGLHQICGHTPDKVRGHLLMAKGQTRTVLMSELSQEAANRLVPGYVRSQNWCLDTHGHSWAKIHDTHLHLARDDRRVDVPAPIVEEPSWPLMDSYDLVPPLSDAPRLRVEWDSVRRRFANTPAWGHLLRALRRNEDPATPPSVPEMEHALNSLKKQGNLTP